MTRVDFHILPDADPDHHSRYFCRLVEKIYRLGHRITVRTDDREEAELLNTRLWDFRADAFLPHGICEARQQHPVAIQWTDLPGENSDVFINMSSSVPDCFSNFERYIEVVSQDQEQLRISREHYRFFRDRGYPIYRHDLRPVN